MLAGTQSTKLHEASVCAVCADRNRIPSWGLVQEMDLLALAGTRAAATGRCPPSEQTAKKDVEAEVRSERTGTWQLQ